MRCWGGRVAGLVVLAALATVAAACGSGAESASPTTSPTTSGDPGGSSATVVAEDETFSVLAGEGVDIDLEALAAALEIRLRSAGHDAAEVEVDGDRVTVDVGDGPLDQAALEDLVSLPGRLEIRPVLLILAPDCDVTVPTGTAEESTYPDFEDGSVIACYMLAPTGLSNEAISDASATLPGTDWIVNPVFTRAGMDAFNDLAAACHAQSAACPTGQVAFAVDGIVVSAPTVNEPTFERDQIQISGAFTEAEAKALAAALRTDPLSGGLEVVE